MSTDIKTVAALHDMSSYGRCALSVITPVLSAMGVQAVAVPTALLSTHTGGFDDFCFTETTDFMVSTLRHFKKLGLEFNAVYSGFLGNPRQVDIVSDYMDASPSAIHLVDPVMGDNGEMYKTYTREMCEKMRSLAFKADIITPNLTEAAIMLGERFPDNPDGAAIGEWLGRLSGDGARSVVITGVRQKDCICNFGFDTAHGMFRIDSQRQNGDYPGTGDIFSAVMLGRLLAGERLCDAVAYASDFVCRCITVSEECGAEKRCGVLLEKMLPLLCRTCD